MLGAVVGLGRQAVDRRLPQPRAQALEQLRPAFRLRARIAEHARAVRMQRLEIPRFQPDDFHGLHQRE
ncbi:hypothetical protein D3C83_110880 [compost metagenome]